MLARIKKLSRTKKAILIALLLVGLVTSFGLVRYFNHFSVMAMEAKLIEKGASFIRTYRVPSFIKPLEREASGTRFESLFRPFYKTYGFEIKGAVIEDDLWRVVSHAGYETIHLTQCHISENNLKEILKSSDLKYLTMVNSGVSDRHVSLFQNRKSLIALNLENNSVTDESLKYLVTCKNLKVLGLSHTLITDQSLSNFPSLTNLIFLGLADNNITDTGILSLNVVNSIENINLSNTLITDKSLQHLSRMKKLKRLDLSGTKITDVGIQELTKLEFLRDLNLGETAITDKSIPHLLKLKSLIYLNVKGSKISDKGINELKMNFPLSSEYFGN